MTGPGAGPAEPRPIAFMLPGQGAQFPRMAAGLYDAEPAFTDALDAFFALLGAPGSRIRGLWLDERAGAAVDESDVAQPLLFGIEYALGRMLADWGAAPSVLLGHSAGEYVAAVLGGVMSLADAAGVLLERVGHFQDAPLGGMLAVVARAEQLEPFLTEQVVLGGVNGPGQLMIAGPRPQFDEVAARLERAGITGMPARTSRGFHSPSVVEACVRSVPAFARIGLRPARVPLISSAYPGLVEPGQARDPEFWAMIPARPILFGPALDLLLARGPHLLVEAGPGQGLSVLARRHPALAAGRSAVLALLGHRPGPAQRDRRPALRARARLAAEGYPVASEPPRSSRHEPMAVSVSASPGG